MRIIKTTKLEEGMVAAMPVKTKHGQLIVDEGAVLTNQLIARISFYGIDCIRIEGEEPQEAPIVEKQPEPEAPKGNVSEPTYSQRVKKTQEFQKFQIEYTSSSSELSKLLEPILAKGYVSKDVLYKTIYPLMDKAHNTIEMFDLLHNMRSIDDSIYAHSLNVALICGMFARWLHFSQDEMDDLLLAALLHDVGKTKIPAEILNKPDKYTDEEFALVKQHPQMGYDILNSYPDSYFDQHIKNAALMHHERCDGSGYPNGLKRDEIDEFAHIIAIADVYDAMTAKRSYRAPLCPFQVIAAFEKEGLQKYHPKYILTFLERIASTYQRNRVLLSNGQPADIVMLNKQYLSRPIVQLNDGECIDLSRTPDIHIQALL